MLFDVFVDRFSPFYCELSSAFLAVKCQCLRIKAGELHILDLTFVLKKVLCCR